MLFCGLGPDFFREVDEDFSSTSVPETSIARRPGESSPAYSRFVMYACCAIRKTFDVAQYTTRPAGKTKDQMPVKSGRIRSNACCWAGIAVCAPRLVEICRCW